jgi:UDP-GlcNAc:undecaprenyl-phosphate/decaprenyl-phosphate GlcNAc-1-phosphate transferase
MEVNFLAIILLLALVTSAVITAYDIPIIISLANRKNLNDAPDNFRKLHKRPIPNLGGIAIFVGIIISFSLWVGDSMPAFYPYLVAGSVLLFTVGVNDDIFAMDPGKKFIAQALAASAVVIGGNVRLNMYDGFLGLHSVPEVVAIGVTIISFIFIINAFNLIDGVDGLAGTLSLIASLFFCAWFFINGHVGEAILAASLAGAMIGFLVYNIAPARIFMGDTGSLAIGLMMAVLAFRLIELNAVSTVYSFKSPTVFALSLLIIPVFDTLRVMFVRLLRRKSPFSADRNHIHHKLLDLGFGHRNICRFLTIAHISIISATIFLVGIEIHFYMFSILALAALIIPTAYILKNLQSRLKITMNPRQVQKPIHIETFFRNKTGINSVLKRTRVLEEKEVS